MTTRYNPGGTTALLLAMAIWGATYVITKAVLDDFGAMTVLAARFAIGFAGLYFLARPQGYRLRMSLDPRFIRFGVVGIVLHNGLETVGLTLTSAGSAALIIAAAPAVTVLFSMVFLKERVTRLQTFGLALSIAGVVMVSGTAVGDLGIASAVGTLLVFGGVVAWAVYTVQGKRMADGYRPLVSTAAGAGSALLFLVPLSMGEMAVTGLPDPTIGSVAGILYLGLLASAAAYLLWNHALTQVDAAFAAPFVNLVPIIGIALALILGETITPMQLAGGGIVGLGVWLSSLKPRVRRKLTREYA